MRISRLHSLTRHATINDVWDGTPSGLTSPVSAWTYEGSPMNPLFKLEEPEDLVLPAAILTDIHPRSPVAALARDFSAADLARSFPIDLVAATVGMAPSYVRVALDTRSPTVTLAGLLFLLDLDAFAETFIPRSRIPAYLLGRRP